LLKNLTTIGLDIIADEECQSIVDIPIIQPYFSGINIKLLKCGGIKMPY